jgi:rubrerythrin
MHCGPPGPLEEKTMTTNATYPEAPARLFEVRELFCGECGYGIVVRRDPPECPMCHTCEWRGRPDFAHWN